MPETESVEVLEVVDEDKLDVMSGTVYDIMASELPEEMQENLPDKGVVVGQAPGTSLMVDTNITSELQEIHVEIPKTELATIENTVGSITLADGVFEHVKMTRAQKAEMVLKYVGESLVREGKIIQKGFKPEDGIANPKDYEKAMSMIGTAIVVSGNVLKAAAKSTKFFKKFIPKKLRK